MLKRKIIAGIMSAALTVSLCPGAALAQELHVGQIAEDFWPQALSEQMSASLYSQGALFDLKVGESLSTSRFLGGVGNIPYTVTLNSAKVTNSTKYKGYREAVLNVTFKAKKLLTTAQKKKVIAAYKKACKSDKNNVSVVWSEKMSAYLRYMLVDYTTGKSLFDSSTGIKVSAKSSWNHSQYVSYKDSKNWSFKEPLQSDLQVTLYYPTTYKNLCFGVGCDKWANAKMTKYDMAFRGKDYYWSGNNKQSVTPYSSTYYQTSFLKKARGNYHFIRLG